MGTSKNTECKAVGTVAAEHAAEVEELLTGMAGREGQEFTVLEVAMRTVATGRPPQQLLLTRPLDREDVAGSSRSWVARMEPLVLRGVVRDLEVGVRVVTEAPMRGISVPAFWESLGLSHSHESIKSGCTYRIEVQQQSVKVSVCQLMKLGERGKPESASEISPGHRLVEITCRVEDGEYALGAQVIGKVGEQLKPLVHLQKC